MTLHIFHNLLSFSVSLPDFEEVNTSWVLRASITDKSKAFLRLLKSNANSEAATHLRQEILEKYLIA